MSYTDHYLSYVSMCRGHSWLLRRKPDCDWCKGHSWYFCHLSGTVPLLAGWIHWSGSHESGLKDYNYKSPSSDRHPILCCIVLHPFDDNMLFMWCLFCVCVCVPGVWHSHAAAVSDGSVRPEEQTGPSGQRACRSGSPGAAHWHFSGQQQWLCYQPHQRHRTQGLHCHSRLGNWCVQVKYKRLLLLPFGLHVPSTWDQLEAKHFC